MTDEVVIPSKEEILAPVEGKEEVAAPALTPAEERAMEDGWVPKDQWKGDPEDWRPAKEFNDRGELFNRIKEQKREVDQLKGAITFLTNQNKEQYVRGHKEAIAELTARRNQALENGDAVVAAEFQDKLIEVKDALKVAQATQVVPQQTGPSQDFISWKDKNSWYMQEEDATMFADSKGLTFKRRNPDSTEKQMLEHVTKEVAKRFPELIPNRAPPSPNGSGSTSPRGNSSSAAASEVEAGMTTEQQQIMKTIMKSTGMTKAEYLKAYQG